MNSEPFKCILCHQRSARPVYSACPDYYLGKTYLANYYECLNCQLVQQSPIPPDVSSFYDAYPIHGKKSLLHRLMRKIVMSPVYFRMSESFAGKKLLDYGCGDGWFLESLKNEGAELSGYEMNAEHALQLQGSLKLPVESNLNELLSKNAQSFDIVTMHFVLEHLPDLHQAFEHVSKLLKPGGIFYYVVPKLDSFESKLFRKKWHNLDSPRHLSFPTEKNSTTLAEKHGFRLVENSYPAFPNGFAGSMPVVLSGKFRFILFLLFLPLGIIFSRVFRGGALGVRLTKIRT